MVDGRTPLSETSWFWTCLDTSLVFCLGVMIWQFLSQLLILHELLLPWQKPHRINKLIEEGGKWNISAPDICIVITHLKSQPTDLNWKWISLTILFNSEAKKHIVIRPLRKCYLLKSYQIWWYISHFQLYLHFYSIKKKTQKNMVATTGFFWGVGGLMVHVYTHSDMQA